MIFDKPTITEEMGNAPPHRSDHRSNTEIGFEVAREPGTRGKLLI